FVSVCKIGVEFLSVRVRTHNRSVKFTSNHFAGITADGVAGSPARWNVGTSQQLSLDLIPRQCPFAGRVSVRVSIARPRSFFSPTTKIVPDAGFSVFGALVPGGMSGVSKKQQ